MMLEIDDFDIAIVEALHDLLMDEYHHEYSSVKLVNARKLVKKMQDALDSQDYCPFCLTKKNIKNLETKLLSLQDQVEILQKSNE